MANPFGVGDPTVDPQSDMMLVAGAPAPFTDIQQQQERDARISTFPQASDPVYTKPQSDEQITQTAFLAALAQHRNNAQDETLDSTVQRLRENIALGKEEYIRAQIAQTQRDDQTAAARQVQSDLMAHPEAYPELSLGDLVNHEVDQSSRPLNMDALEEEGVSRIQNLGAQDTHQAQVYARILSHGDVLDNIRDNVVKMQLFNRELDRLRSEQAEGSVLGQVVQGIHDFLASAIPFNAVTAQLGIVPGNRTTFRTTPGTNLQNEALTLWGKPLAEFERDLPLLLANAREQASLPILIPPFQALIGGRNPTLELSSLEALRGVADSDALTFTAWTAVDAASVLPMGWLARSGRNGIRMAQMLGNRSGAARAAASDLMKDSAGLSASVDGVGRSVASDTAALVESLPSSVVPPTVDLLRPYTGIASDVADAVEATQRAVAEVRLTTTSRLEAPQMQQAVANRIKEIEQEFKAENIVDFKRPTFRINPSVIADEHAAEVAAIETEAARGADRRLSSRSARVAPSSTPLPTRGIEEPRFNITEDLDTGIIGLDFYLGRRSGAGGYVSQEAAGLAIERRGLDPATTALHQNVDGQWFLKVHTNVDETGVYTPVLKDADFHNVNHITQYFLNPSNKMPELWNEARLTQTLQRTHIQTNIIKPWQKHIAAIWDYRTLKTVLAVGEENQKWWNFNELAYIWERTVKHPISHKEAIAYYAAKELSDFNWSVLNREAYVSRARRNVSTVRVFNEASGIDTGRINGQIITNPDFNTTRIFDLETLEHAKAGTRIVEFQEKMATGNFRVIVLEKTYMYNGEPVRYVLAHKRNSSVGPLARQQIGYIPGGSRENLSKYYVKQAVRGTFGDGEKYYLNPTTHIAASTDHGAHRWADRMEHARATYVNPEATTAQKMEAVANSPVENWETWERMIASGEIQKDTPFEVLFDKAMPSEMTGFGDNVLNWADPELSGLDQYQISKGRMYYSAKGDRLRDPDGNYAEILDPLRTLGRAIATAVNTQAFGAYNKKVIEEWARVAGPYIRNRDIQGFDANRIFFDGQLSQELQIKNPQLYNQLTGTRMIHKRFLNISTNQQALHDVAVRRFAEWIDGKGKTGEYIAGRALNSLSYNPVEAVRGFVFDAVLGFFDPSQLIVQTQTAVAAISVHPLWGARAAATTTPLLWLMRNKTPNLLDYIAKNAKLVHGFEEAEFKALVTNLRANSWLQVGGDVIQLDQYANKLGGSLIAKSGRSIRHAGRYPFYLAERINRSVAYQIAWKEIRQKLPELEYTTEEFAGKVLQRADDWAANMTSASRAGWQKDALSIPTQFLAYQARFLENILPKSFGGNPRFSNFQKAKLVLGQTLLYGAGGLYGGDALLDWMSEKYQEANGKPMDEATYHALSRGFFDTIAYQLSGGEINTDFSSRVGQGEAWSDLFTKMSNGDLNSFLDVWGGAAGSIVGDTIDSIGHVVRYFKSEQIGLPTTEVLGLIAQDLTRHISSLSRAQKAYWVFKLGFVYDRKTGLPIVSATQLEGFAAALGVPLSEETERWDFINKQMQRADFTHEMGQELARIRRNAFRALEAGDFVAAENYGNIASGMLMIYRDDPMMQQEINTEASKTLGYTQEEWTNLVIRMRNRGMQLPYTPTNEDLH